MPRRFIASDQTIPSYYHCVSRVVDRRFAFQADHRERFVKLLRACAVFSNVRVLTYCVLSNHFHLLIEVPARPAQDPDDAEYLRRLAALYPGRFVREVRDSLARYRSESMDDKAEALRAPYLARMDDISHFMKTLKQRFSIWYNRTHDRVGTLWEERFRSVVVEGSEGDAGLSPALRVIGDYIHLNPVRAGIVTDSDDYRWSGAGATAGGDRAAREGLHKLAALSGDTSEADGIRSRPAAGGAITTLRQFMRSHRIRYFTAGVALGTLGFLEQFFRDHWERFGPRRATGARPLRGVPTPNLYTVRDLQKDRVSPSRAQVRPRPF